MESLFKSEFNSPVVGVFSLLIWVMFPGVSMLSLIAVIISLHQFVLLFNSIGYLMPVRYLFGAFMCLQFFIGPVLAYNGLDEFQYPLYRMVVSEAEYFGYAIPAVCAFIIALHITAGNLVGEHIDIEHVKAYVQKNPKLPYIFIVMGFFTSIISGFLPAELAFVFVILGGFKFVGLFMLILGQKQLAAGPMLVVFGSIVSSSLGEGMFHDLLTWLIFTGAVFLIRYKPTLPTKLALCAGFVLLSVVIQQLKGELRTNIRSGKGGGLESLSEAYYSQQEKEGIFSFAALAPSNVRINQGFIITNIMKTVPSQVPFSNGEELGQILEAAFLPRVLAPNKLMAGDRTIFMKYSGIELGAGTSMGLSSVGDAYLNFGVVGGCILMFLLGLGYSEILKVFQRKSPIYPILILFVPLIFYYPIRPDSELQTLLGHVVKSCFLLYLIFRYLSNLFVADEQEDELESVEEQQNESPLAPSH